MDFTEKFQLIRSSPGLIQIVGVIPLESQERGERITLSYNINETIKATKECSQSVGVVADGEVAGRVLR